MFMFYPDPLFGFTKTSNSERLVLKPLTVPKVEPGVRYKVRTEIVPVPLVHDTGIQSQQHVGEDPGDLTAAGIREHAGGDEPLRV